MFYYIPAFIAIVLLINDFRQRWNVYVPIPTVIEDDELDTLMATPCSVFELTKTQLVQQFKLDTPRNTTKDAVVSLVIKNLTQRRLYTTVTK